MKINAIASSSLFTAIGASLCCLTPLLAVFAGTTTVATSLEWLEPARPYLIGVSIMVLSWAWYQQLKPKRPIDCDCETPSSFWQSRKFLVLVTVSSLLLMGFPHYSSSMFSFGSQQVESEVFSTSKHTFKVTGMTCSGCENHIIQAVSTVDGVDHVQASFTAGTATIGFDSAKVSIQQLQKAIDLTGYKVIQNNE